MKHDINTITSYRRALRKLESEIAATLASETLCCQVSVAQCHLLLETEFQKEASLTELSDELNLDASTLSRTADSLVRDGLLERRVNPENRRKVAIRLSPAGQAKADQINTLCNADADSVFAAIPPDKQAQVIESVQLLAEAMKRKRQENPPMLPIIASELTFKALTRPVGSPSPRELSTALTPQDRLDDLRVRFDIGRHDYALESGLYFIGKPEEDSAVLVTANYRLTVNSLRKELTGLNLWILVLETDGINVWCAAGKGSFGTAELLKRLKAVNLKKYAPRATIILPQLGAPGVAAFKVAAATGYRVKIGPVRAADIKAYLAAGFQATPGMRRVHFGLRDRLTVAPVEIAHSAPLLLAAAALAIFFGLTLSTSESAMQSITRYGLLLGGSVMCGTLIFPALLPVLPFKAFSLKGAVLALLWFLTAFTLGGGYSAWPALPFLSCLLISVPAVSYLAMNFTGASTFTCQKGTEAEVRSSVPFMLVSATAGVLTALAHLALFIIA